MIARLIRNRAAREWAGDIIGVICLVGIFAIALFLAPIIGVTQ